MDLLRRSVCALSAAAFHRSEIVGLMNEPVDREERLDEPNHAAT